MDEDMNHNGVVTVQEECKGEEVNGQRAATIKACAICLKTQQTQHERAYRSYPAQR